MSFSSKGISVCANGLCRDVSCRRKQKRILDNISFSVQPGELAAVIGSSGSGKSTLINCLNGFEPATCGTVFINGQDLAHSFAALKKDIGYVPQSDIVHDNLRLHSMLKFTAKLRLPKSTTDFEIDIKISDVLRTMGLTDCRDRLIRKLSGGQRKRACIASELISDPSLFLLDEPTSGLDPEAETLLMKQLRRLSHERGKTVVCITHTLQNISLFDKIIFLAPGGRLCFFGTHSQALDFFDVGNLTDAYELISGDPERYVSAYCALSEGAVH